MFDSLVIPCKVSVPGHRSTGFCAKIAFAHLPASPCAGSRNPDEQDMDKFVAFDVCDEASGTPASHKQINIGSMICLALKIA